MHHSKHQYLNIQCIKSLWFANKRKRPNQECHCGHLSHPGKEVPDETEEDGGPAADQIGTRILFCWDTWQTTPQQSISESQASMESTGLESMSLPSRTWTQEMPWQSNPTDKFEDLEVFDYRVLWMFRKCLEREVSKGCLNLLKGGHHRELEVRAPPTPKSCYDKRAATQIIVNRVHPSF